MSFSFCVSWGWWRILHWEPVTWKAFSGVRLETFPCKSAQFVTGSSRNQADLVPLLQFSLQFKVAPWNCVSLYDYFPGPDEVHALSSCPVFPLWHWIVLGKHNTLSDSLKLSMGLFLSWELLGLESWKLNYWHLNNMAEAGTTAIRCWSLTRSIQVVKCWELLWTEGWKCLQNTRTLSLMTEDTHGEWPRHAECWRLSPSQSLLRRMSRNVNFLAF